MPSERDSEVFYRPGDPVTGGGWTRVHTRRWLIVGLAMLVLASGAWLYLEETSRVATLSNDIRLLHEQEGKLRLEIAMLNAQIAEAGSLERVRAYAEQHGYVPASAGDMSMVTVTVQEQTVSNLASEVAPIATPAPVLDQPDDTGLFGGLLQALGWTGRAPVTP